MKTLFAMALCLVLGLSLLAGCGGGGSAIQSLQSPPPHSPSSALTLVNPPPVMPQGTVGQFYSQGLNGWVQGGVGLITFTLKSGMLPAGLTLNPDGALSGIPTAVYASTVVITVTDSGNPPSSVNLSISITINPTPPLEIKPGSGALPSGTVGAPYQRPPACGDGRKGPCGLVVYAMGGVVPYGFSAAGSLPPGLSFVSGIFVTPDGSISLGVISGTPTTAGTYNFVVTVTDSESPPKQASAHYTITIAPAPSPSPSSSP